MRIALPRLAFAMLAIVLSRHGVQACLWDRDTLADERKKSPEFADLIFGSAAKSVDAASLLARIDSLRRHPKQDDPGWWNDLAGAYIRIGNPAEAAKLLESVSAKFPDDYGIHANLGTAYHLLGRYVEAEREISRDLELQPDGHFGLEKYHLALLQYLSRDSDYQAEHVYVDEFSSTFVHESPFSLPLLLPDRAEEVAAGPAYRQKWNLAEDPKLRDGVIYMASLNPKQPACFVMLGIVALRQPGRNQDLHLAMAAFEKAIGLGSPQEALLREHIATIRSHLTDAGRHRTTEVVNALIAVVAVAALVAVLVLLAWKRRRARESIDLRTR